MPFALSRPTKTYSRNLIAELNVGFDTLAQEREGKLTPRRFEVQAQPAPALSAQGLLRVREQLQLSRPVFARSLRTLENWEQGRAKPNAQAALLIRLVAQYPDTVQRLQTV